MTKATITKAQQAILDSLHYAPTNYIIGFAQDPSIKALLAKGLITFTPMAFGAGRVSRTRGGA